MNKKLALISGLFFIVVSVASTAEQLALEEIVVAARKIAENSQTVPISMSVLTQEKMNDLNIFDFTEIDRIVPSLQLGQNSPASATLKIRNVGPDFFALAFPAAVAVYVDGVPQTQPGSVFSTMLDIERIEVLNGPQGTLYGKNAPAGLVSLYSASPHTDSVSGYISSSYSSWQTSNTSAALNVPLIEDKLAMRIAGLYAESDGFMNNAIPGVSESNGKEHKAYRIKFLWHPRDDMQLLVSHYYADLYTEDNGGGFEGQVPDDRELTNFESSYDDYEVFKGIPSYSDTEVEDLTFNWSWDLDAVSLSLLGQYQDLDIFQQQDNSNYRIVPPPEVLRDFLVFDPQSYSLEFRADGEINDRLSFVSGAIYSDEDVNTTNFINNINIVGTAQTGSWGIYSNWTYAFSERWDASLGVRYSDITYEATVLGFIPGLGELNTAYEQDYTDPSYSFKLRFYPAQDMLAYLAIDTALRSGGINVLAPLAGELVDIVGALPGGGPQQAQNLQTISEDYFEFDQEDSIAYEIGFKGTFLEQRLRWNLSAFFQVYEDHQFRTSPTDDALTTLLAGAFSNLAVNVEELEVYGFETELQYLIDENWSIFSTAAYAKPEIQEYQKRMCEEGEAAPGVLVCPGEKGEQLNDEPLLHVLTQLRYERALADTNMQFFVLFTSEYFDEPYQRVKTPNLQDVYTFDLTFGLEDSGGKWSAKVWSKNLTDETAIFAETLEQRLIDDPVLGSVQEFQGYSASPRAPRSVGVSVDYRF